MLSTNTVLDPSQATIRHREVSGGVQFDVYDQDGIRWLGTGDGAIQAAVQLSELSNPVMNYIRTMVSGLALTATPERVLDLGYGCGTLARCVRQAAPDAKVVSVEANHAVVDIAHRWLGGDTPDTVLMARAEKVLAQPQTPVDAIFCDLHADPSHANPITDTNFHASAAALLRENGVYVVNLLPRNNADAVALIQPLRKHFQHIWLSPVLGCQNLVVHARKKPIETLNLAAPFAHTWQQRTPTLH